MTNTRQAASRVAGEELAGLTQDLPADRDDQVRLDGHVEEGRGQEQPALGVAPAQQRLEREPCAGRQSVTIGW